MGFRHEICFLDMSFKLVIQKKIIFYAVNILFFISQTKIKGFFIYINMMDLFLLTNYLLK